jgi:hypothetical protein
MVCPVLGDKSIIHRLRLLSRGEASPRRRLLGRGLIFAGALALPFTASVSYAQRPQAVAAAPASAGARSQAWPAAQMVQASVGPGNSRLLTPPSATMSPLPPADGAAHLVPPAPPMPLGVLAPPSPPAPPAPPAPPSSPSISDPTDPRFEAEMERWSDSWERWGEQWDEQWEQWGEAFAAQAEAEAEMRAMAADRHEAHGIAAARSSLQSVRASIAGNSSLSAEIRREIIQSLDAELAQLGR